MPLNTVRPYLYTFILIVSALLGKAQQQLEARLHGELDIAKTDTAKARLYSELARMYSNGNTDSLKTYAYKSLAVFKKDKNDYSGMYAYNAIAAYYRSESVYDSALYYYNEARKKAEKLGNWRRVISGYNNMSNVYCDVGKFDKSVACGFKALSLAEKIKNGESLAKTHKSLISPYNEMEMWPEVVYHSKAGLSYFLPHKDSANAARCYSGLGIGYIQLKNTRWQKMPLLNRCC
ncbi:MAG: hypothetical protein M0D57_09530 [Sphingobacteriales bacterium JAD_PAG50586_3]|nr:MAG: hypothetical protein M0D57_09530 [Sphingobacteriales bacterium JAD_PAG50586_3]